MKYIYVFAETDRDKLLDLGFLLLGQKDNASLWAFVDKTGASIDLDSALSSYVTSNVLMLWYTTPNSKEVRKEWMTRM